MFEYKVCSSLGFGLAANLILLCLLVSGSVFGCNVCLSLGLGLAFHWRVLICTPDHQCACNTLTSLIDFNVISAHLRSLSEINDNLESVFN